MSYTVRRHPKIDEDLDNIYYLIADYAGSASGLRIVEQIDDDITLLAEGPHRGTYHHYILQGLRVYPTVKKGALCFVIDEARKEVQVLAVAYAGQDWARMAAVRNFT